jgi:MFS family permease
VVGGVSRRTIVCGTVASSLVLASLAYARSELSIVLLVAALGLTLELYRPAAQALLMDLVPASERARAFSLVFWAANLGFAIAMTSGGLLAQTSFADLFLTDALTGLAFGVLVFSLIPEAARRAAVGSERGYARVLRDRTMVIFTVCVVIYYFVYFQCDSTLPLAMRADGVAPAAYGLCMALNGLLILFVSPLLGPCVLGRRHINVLAAGVGMVGVGFGLNAFAHSTASYFATLAVWSVGEILAAAVSGAIISTLAPESLRGRYAGLYGVAWSSGWLTSSLGGTRLLSISPQLLWGACGVLSLATAAMLVALGPRIAARGGTLASPSGSST